MAFVSKNLEIDFFLPVETESHYGNPMLDYHREVLPKNSRTYTMCFSEIALPLKRILSAHEKVKVLTYHKRAVPKVRTPPKNSPKSVYLCEKYFLKSGHF